MERTKIATIYKSPQAFYAESVETAKIVHVCGWVRFERRAKKGTMIFIDLYDGSTQQTLSVVIERTDDPSVRRTPSDVFDKFVDDVTDGVSVSLEGYVSECKGVREQDLELVVTKPIIVGTMPRTAAGAGVPDYPIQKSNMFHLGYLRDYPHLRFKTDISSCLMKVRSVLAQHTTLHMRSEGVHWIDPNMLTRSDCEGGGETFTVTTLVDPSKSVDEIADHLRKPFKTKSQLEDAQASAETVETIDADLDKIDFSKDSFGVHTSLTVSSQLQLEAAACGMGDSYTCNTSFRAEKSKTYKHVSEFKHVEYEGVFIRLPELLKFTEKFIKGVLMRTLEECRPELERLHRMYETIMTSKVERAVHVEFEELFKTRPVSLEGSEFLRTLLLHFTEIYGDLDTPLDREDVSKSKVIHDLISEKFEAVKESKYKKGQWLAFKSTIVKYLQDIYLEKFQIDHIAEVTRFCSKPFTILPYRDAIDCIKVDAAKDPEVPPIEFGDDIGSDHEKYLVKKFDGFVFVTCWPAKIKSFYMRQSREDPELCENFDLLAPRAGEMFGGSIREEDHDRLKDTIESRGMSVETLQWYLDLRKYGSVPHGGWGWGFDRGLLFLTGAPSIKDVIPFPVSYKSLQY